VSYIAKRNVIATTFTFDGNLFTWVGTSTPEAISSVHGDNQANTVGAPVNPHGFLRTKDGEYRSLDVQGAISTQVIRHQCRPRHRGRVHGRDGTHGFVYRLKT